MKLNLISIRSYWRLYWCLPQRCNVVWETILEYTSSKVLFTLIYRVSESTYLYLVTRARTIGYRKGKHFPSKYALLGKFRWLNRKFGFTTRIVFGVRVNLPHTHFQYTYRTRERDQEREFLTLSCFINSRATVSQMPFRLRIFRYYDSLKCRSGFPVIRVTCARGLTRYLV